MAVDLEIKIGTLQLKNPVMPASGTFADLLSSVMDFDELGALVTKTVTEEIRDGNPAPRAAEVANGVIWNIGIPSKGVDYFLATTLPFYQKYSAPLVVSVSAPSAVLFAQIAERLTVPGVAAIEANISCPNLEEDGKTFAAHPSSTGKVMTELRRATDLPVWVKLSPNTEDIGAVARAAESEGADAVVVANTILAMSVDLETFEPTLGGVWGGLSGPAVKPIILRMAYQCAKAVRIPVIGCGGICTAEDVVEYMLVGASAVQIGMATFVRPQAMTDIIRGLRNFAQARGISRISDLKGAMIERRGVSPERTASSVT
jgi:dihydroorotate dehydrogenase (NAD+) catalytic subunit